MVAAKWDESGYEMMFERWMAGHIQRATGERQRKLKEGLSFAELAFLRDVWYVAFRNFNFLHPQYEIRDFKDGIRFLDFACLKGGLRLAIEIDPFGTHARNLSRWEHDDQLDRHNDLVLDDWKVMRFSLDQIQKNQRKCQQKLQHGLGKWGAIQDSQLPDSPIDQAIMTFMKRRGEALSPIQAARELGWHKSTIARHMAMLAKDHYLLQVGSNNYRARKYILNLNRDTI